MSREKRLIAVSCEKPPCDRVTVDVAPSILQPPPALRPIVSASLCPLGWEERRGEAAEESSASSEARRGGEKSPPPPLSSGQSQRSSAGSRRCSLSPYRLCCLQGQSETSKQVQGCQFIKCQTGISLPVIIKHSFNIQWP